MNGMLVKPLVAFCHQNPLRLTLEAYFPNKLFMIAYSRKTIQNSWKVSKENHLLGIRVCVSQDQRDAPSCIMETPICYCPLPCS